MKQRYGYLTIMVLLPALLSGLLYPSVVGANSHAGAHTAQAVFSLLEDASGIQSDDFNTCELNEFWDFVNPLGDCTAETEGTFSGSARLSISVPGGTSHSISDSNTDAPRVMQPAANTDFGIRAKFTSALSEEYQVQGILVEGTGEDEFLRFDFFSRKTSGTLGGLTEINIYAASLVGGVLTQQHKSVIPPAPSQRYHMRVERVGNTWTQSYSYDGSVYTETTTFAHTMTVSAVGVFGGNSGESPPAHTALVDYFLNIDSPFEDEDGDRNELTLIPVGNGDLNKSPDRSYYSCYEPVTLTAEADPGWDFIDWSGDLVSTNNPETISMTGSRVITGTFAEAYTLTINKNGNGTVTKDPDQTTYHYGDVVTLTATADPGWTFASWSGALSGTDNPATLTITGDTSVTATFTKDEYTLTITPIGDGTVDKDPDQTTYHYGDVVTLTATADPGWTFAGWSGALSGTDNPATLTITGDTSVTATFTYEGYGPVLDIVKDGPAVADVGDTVVYTFTVTNDAINGDGSPVSNVSVSDDYAGAATYVSGDDGDGLLEVGEAWVYTASYTIQDADPDPLVNTGTVTGEDLDGAPVSDTDTHSTQLGFAPALSIVKSGPDAANVGDTVVYTFTVTNDDVNGDGSVISNVSVSDDVAGTATYVSGDDGDGLLEVGETWVYTASYTIKSTDPDPLVNTGTVTGKDLDGAPVSDTDTHSTAIRGPLQPWIFLPITLSNYAS